jgi:hypothetical protein
VKAVDGKARMRIELVGLPSRRKGRRRNAAAAAAAEPPGP